MAQCGGVLDLRTCIKKQEYACMCVIIIDCSCYIGGSAKYEHYDRRYSIASVHVKLQTQAL
jgi:hypothetical protein